MILSDTEASPLQTLALMSNAQFFVGSNSSLSWWGAYLATKSGNPCILPEKWSQWGNYENSRLKNELIQFFPSTWMLSGHSEIY